MAQDPASDAPGVPPALAAALESFEPARADHFFRAITRLLSARPLPLAAGYTTLAFGGTLALAHIDDAARGTAYASAMLGDLQALINLLLLTPLGLLALLNFYDSLKRGLAQLLGGGVIRFASDDDAADGVRRFDASLNKPWFFWVALAASLVTNYLFVYDLSGTWNSLDAGPHAWWFRAFVIVNMFVIFHVLLKGVVIVRAMAALFDTPDRLDLQPLHPDRCGGVRALGRVAMAQNYFLCVVAVFISVMAVVSGGGTGGTSSDFFLFPAIVGGFLLLAVYLFFGPLSRAHAVMEQARDRELSRLNAAFQALHRQITDDIAEGRGLSLEEAQKVQVLERLYQIVSGMPVWPFDVRILAQFAIAVALPLLVGVAVEIASKALGD